MSEILIRLDSTYKTERGEFVHLSQATIPIELPLDVNVQDLFKPSALFSRFSIRTPNENPLRVLDVELAGTDEYVVQSPPGQISPMTVFPKQPVSLLYKLTRTVIDTAEDTKPDPLSLKVQYQCSDELVLTAITSAFRSAIQSSTIAHLERLLISTLTEQMKTGFNKLGQRHDYEQPLLTSMISINPDEMVDWSDILEGLPENDRNEARSWLHTWHEVCVKRH